MDCATIVQEYNDEEGKFAGVHLEHRIRTIKLFWHLHKDKNHIDSGPMHNALPGRILLDTSDSNEVDE